MIGIRHPDYTELGVSQSYIVQPQKVEARQPGHPSARGTRTQNQSCCEVKGGARSTRA